MSASLLRQENAALKRENEQLRASQSDYQQVSKKLADTRDQLTRAQQQLDWFKRQLFGEKSEKRHDFDPARQADLLGDLAPPVDRVTERDTPQSRPPRRKQRSADTVTSSGLRFDASVPVKVVELPCPEINGLSPDQYEQIGQKVTYKLAQRPASYEVIKYIRPTFKLKADLSIVTAPPAPSVLEHSFADVSFLAGMLCDKFLYHLPLYRQHQRLSGAGITVSRYSLTHLMQRAVELLTPIYDAQKAHILQSQVLALDETPIKAGRQKGRPGKMKQAYFWPIYGEADEMVFPFTPTKNFAALEGLLKDWQVDGGTLLADGAAVYDKYAATLDALIRAACWAHTRREFERAGVSNPDEAADALILIGEIYAQEATIRERALTGDAKLQYRVEHVQPRVVLFWQWCEAQSQRAWTSVDKIGDALKYALTRRAALEVFLADPDVAIDTNHLERGLRCVPMGRKNWLFAWTEIGAKHIGIIQSLLVTCRLHGVHPFTYLVDVLQRVGQHPASQVEELTPRRWKALFAHAPLTSVVWNQ